MVLVVAMRCYFVCSLDLWTRQALSRTGHAHTSTPCDCWSKFVHSSEPLTQKCWEEFNVKVPLLTTLISAVAIRKEQKNLAIKTQQALIPAVTSVIGKCLAIYSNQLSSMKTFYSLLLSEGGTKDTALDRLASLHDCLSTRMTLNKLNGMAANYDIPLRKMREEGRPYVVVFDNVDKYIRPRHQSSTSSNKMVHMVQAIAVAERVNRSPQPHVPDEPEIQLEEINKQHLLPSTDDEASVRAMMVHQVKKAWRQHVPGLSWIDLDDQHHAATESTTLKSVVVSSCRPLVSLIDWRLDRFQWASNMVLHTVEVGRRMLDRQ